MDGTNKAIGLLCITAVVVAVILRAGNTGPRTVVVAEKQTPVSLTRIKPAGLQPQDSDFRFIQSSPDSVPSFDTTNDFVLPGTTGVNVQTQPVTEEAVQDDPLADLYPDLLADNSPATTYSPLSDNTATWINDPPVDRPGELTDREMFDRLISFMDVDQRSEFRVVWVTMSPDEREQFISEMRGRGN